MRFDICIEAEARRLQAERVRARDQEKTSSMDAGGKTMFGANPARTLFTLVLASIKTKRGSQKQNKSLYVQKKTLKMNFNQKSTEMFYISLLYSHAEAFQNMRRICIMRAREKTNLPKRKPAATIQCLLINHILGLVRKFCFCVFIFSLTLKYNIPAIEF